MRANAFGRDVFVQNVAGELRAFVNVCQHRGFPIRRASSGNGPILCGFHAWRYDGEGRLVGIARNEELYGIGRDERLSRSLETLRVATAGSLVLVAPSEQAPPLADYLGRHLPLLKAVSSGIGPRRHRWTGEAHANWKLYYEITLDDYHVAFVHPETLGQSIHPAWAHVCGREAAHSHLFIRRTDGWTFPGLWEAIERGSYEYAGYKIQHIFPSLFVVVAREMVIVTRLTPLRHDLTEVDDWVFEVTGNTLDEAWWEGTIATHRAISAEDKETCEAQQGVIADFGRRPVYGRLEQRVAWFHDAYERIVGVEARRRATRRD